MGVFLKNIVRQDISTNFVSLCSTKIIDCHYGRARVVSILSFSSAETQMSVLPIDETESDGGGLIWNHHHNIHMDSKYLSDHAVPHVVDLLAMFSIGDQVEVVGKLDVPRYLLQNVNAETFAALLNVGTS